MDVLETLPYNPGMWDTAVHWALLKLLLAWGMDSTTLVAPRLWDPPDPFTLPVVARVLTNPWELAVLDTALRDPWGKLPEVLGLTPPEPWRRVPRSLNAAVVLEELGAWCGRAKGWWASLRAVHAGAQDTFLAALPYLALDENDTLIRARWGEVNALVGRTWEGDTLPDTTLFRSLQAVPFRDIWEQGLRERAFLRDVLPFLQRVASVIPTGSWHTHGCALWVGTWEDDRYTPEAMEAYDVILDPGGNDRYEGVPSGLGRFQVVVDLQGDDVYTGDVWGAPAGGIWGSAWIVDASGSDVYRGTVVSLGAGAAGVGGILDLEGEDTYRCEQFCLAAGGWGLGVVEDGHGHDVYVVDVGGEAFARTGGLAVLVDGEGQDTYVAGASRHHQPLLPDVPRGMAQGFAMGYRPYASGGLALLLDRGGSDRYTSPVYGQGAAYWKALGALVDLAGSDVYTGVQYVQGAGIHLAVGVLLDGEGRDRYTGRWGPSLGSGHDLGVGVLLDREGDDIYEVSGGLGMGLAGGVGILVDGRGDDLYRLTEPRGLGSGDTARGTGSIGLFVDLSGQDRYLLPDPVAGEGTLWQRGETGWGMDGTWTADTLPAVVQDTAGLGVLLDTASLATLYREARRWGVGNRRLWVQRVRDALAARGGEALRFLIPDRLRDPYPLNWRVLKHVVRAHPDTAGPLLREVAFWHPSDTVQALAVRLLAEIGDTAEFRRILRLWKPGKSLLFQRAFLRALATFGVPEACSLLTALLDEESPVVRVYATTAYGASGCPLPGLFRKLEDPVFPVVQAAWMQLASREIPEDTLRERLRRCREPSPGCVMLVRLLGRQKELSWKTRVLLARLPDPLLRWVPPSLRVRLPLLPSQLAPSVEEGEKDTP